jgi:hypothetical protein
MTLTSATVMRSSNHKGKLTMKGEFSGSAIRTTFGAILNASANNGPFANCVLEALHPLTRNQVSVTDPERCPPFTKLKLHVLSPGVAKYTLVASGVPLQNVRGTVTLTVQVGEQCGQANAVIRKVHPMSGGCDN